MSWGTELWDQYENISTHTQKGIEFMERYSHFLRDRCAIEQEYAGKLRRLTKTYQLKKKEEDDTLFTSYKAFATMLNEINDLAGQHEVVAEDFLAQIVKEIAALSKDLKEERKKQLQEGTRLNAVLQHSLCQLDKTKKAYERAFREAERAQDNFKKVDEDLNLSRAEVEKARSLQSLRNQQCDDSKNEYANQLQKTNDLQNQHFSELMPNIFQKLQEMDEGRVSAFRIFLRKSADIERNVFPIISQCLDGISKAADSVDPAEDSKIVVDRFKSGFQPPSCIPFEDLSNMKNCDSNSTVSFPSIKSEPLTLKGTLSAGKLKKRGGLFGIFGSNKTNAVELKDDYSDLPPNQRKKKLQQKIDQINAQIQQETGARDGLMKMKVVYEQNPALGDPLSVEGQLTENGHRLDKLRQDLHKYQTYMAEAEGVVTLTPNAQKRHRNSISDDSLSRSASDSSVSNPTVNRMSTPNPPRPLAPHSAIGVDMTGIPDAEYEDTADGDFYDLEPLPALGTCRALYAFDGASLGEYESLC